MNISISILKILIQICFIIIGIIIYYTRVCIFNDCKLLTNNGLKNVMPLDGFIEPFRNILNIKLFLHLLLSPVNPWIYMIIMY